MTEDTADNVAPTMLTYLRDDTNTTRLSGRMGVGTLMLTVLAFSAPIAVVAGYIPFIISFGGPAATVMVVGATVSLLLFAVGYVTMARSLPKPGSFYTFISAGLGKVTGLGAAFLAVVGYLVFLSGCFPFIGLTATELLGSMGAANTPWWLWTLIAWIGVSILCYFNIEVSARILSVAMVLEVAVVMVFNVAVVWHGGGPEGLSIQPLNPARLSEGDVGVALLFSIMIFIGFEATAVFRDELRDPDRTMPRATYGAVLFIGALYVMSCYLLTTAYGSDAVQAATDDPKMMFAGRIGSYIAPFFTQLTFLLIVTSELAAAISIFNVTSRYLYNLGMDRALPHYFAHVHPRHGSPARASVTVAALLALLLVVLGLTSPQGVGLDVQLFGLGTVGILILMVLVSLAVIAWFTRRGIPLTANRFKCFVAPALAVAVLGSTLVLGVLHFDLVVGGAPGQNLGLLAVLGASFVVGVVVALYYRAVKPTIFASLGRADTNTAVEASQVDSNPFR